MNGIINMIVRTVVHRLVHMGVNKGVEMATRKPRPQDVKDQDPEQLTKR